VPIINYISWSANLKKPTTHLAMSGGLSVEGYNFSMNKESLIMQIQNTGKQTLRRLKGFTLIELIVTVLIVGVVFTAGIPGLQSLLGNVSLNSNADKLVNSLAYARGEAVARVGNVSVTLLGGSQSGWNIYIDTDTDCIADAGEEILRVVNITADNVIISIAGDACALFNELGESRVTVDVEFTIDSLAASSGPAVVSVSPIGYTTIN
jgi:prepilin-type N-terminal cleavage/methylation domain-containing protein